MISLGRWPGDPGRKPKLFTHQKIQPRKLLMTNICNPCPDKITSLSFSGTVDHDLPTHVLCDSTATTLCTTTYMRTTCTAHTPGQVNSVGHQQHTAGHSHVPHTADHTAHYGAGGREWDTGDGGSDVTALPGLSPNVSNYLSNGAHSVCTTSEEGGLILA